MAMHNPLTNVGIKKTVTNGEYFTLSTMRNWTNWEAHVESIFISRQRSIQSKRMHPWEHEDQFSFGGGSHSPSRPLRNRYHQSFLFWFWKLFLIMIVNGIKKYVKEMTEETQVDHIDYIGDSTGKFLAKARPEQTSIPTTSSPTVTLPYLLRDWIDVEPGQYDKSCFEVSKKMIRLLRHDLSVLREEDGAVMFRSDSRLLSIGQVEHGCIICQKEEDLRRDSSIVWIHSLSIPSCTRSLWRKTLRDNVLLPSDFVENIYHVGSSSDMHSIIQSGLILGGKDVKKGRHAVCFTAREPNVHRSLSREGLRRDEAQDCSVQTQLGNTPKHSVLV